MTVALCLKFQSDPCCNLAMGKSDENTKHYVGSLIQKFICYYSSFVFTEERVNRAQTKLITLDELREIYCCEKRESRHRPKYYISHFLL